MSVPVKISDILDASDSSGDEIHYWLDRETGRVEMLTEEILGAARDNGKDRNHPEWMLEAIELAYCIEAAPERFAEFPDRFEINEWRLMEEFTRTIADTAITRDLDRAIHGKGAFRRFNSALDRNDLWTDWNAFKQEALLDLACEWCQQNNIPYVDDVSPAESK